MRDDSEEMLEFPLVHHASVRTPRPSFRLRRKQVSPLLLGDFDLPV